MNPAPEEDFSLAENQSFEHADRPDYTAMLRDARAEGGPEERNKAAESGIEKVMLEDAANLIATVANNEAKAITFLAMAQAANQTLSRGDIYRAFLDIQGEDGGWPDMRQSGPGYYAVNSFEPIGMVAKSVDSTSGKPKEYFSTTSYGARRGMAVAGIMLDLSLQNPDISLYEIFGQTGTSSEKGRRSPQTRLEILFELDKDPAAEMNITTLAENMNVNASVITTQVASLENAGILEARRLEPNASETSIIGIDSDALNIRQTNAWAGPVPAIIAQILEANPPTPESPLNFEHLYAQVKAALPDKDAHQIRETLQSDLLAFDRKGYITMQKGLKHDLRSAISICEDKRELIDKLLLNVLMVMDGDEDHINAGIERAEAIAADKNAINQLLTKAREASPFHNRLAPAEFIPLITTELAGTELTAVQLAQIFTERGKPTTPANINKIMRAMRADGTVEYDQRQGTYYYRLAGQIPS